MGELEDVDEPRPFFLNSTSSTTTHHHLHLHPPPPPSPDISLYYTLTYAASLAFNLAYLVLENALVGWIFITVELALALLVIAAKLWLERGGRGKKDAEAKKQCAEQMERERKEKEKEAQEQERERVAKMTAEAGV